MIVYVVVHEQEDMVEEVTSFSTEAAANQFCHDLLLPMWREAFGDKPWGDDPAELLHPSMADIISDRIDPPGLRVTIWDIEVQ